MKTIFPILILFLVFTAKSQQGIEVPQLNHCDQILTNLMNDHKLDGISMALSKDGKIVYARSYGFADKATGEMLYPYHKFRIASVSKPLTGMAMMKLWQDGKVDLDQPVFGENGIMKDNEYFNNMNIQDERVYQITTRMLLEHTAGFDRNKSCYGFSGCDPIGFPLFVTQTLGEGNPVQKKHYVKFLVEKGLDFDPGSKDVYSNIGFTLAGLVIEEITGMTYYEYVKSDIMDEIGICDMEIAGNFIEDRKIREVNYNAKWNDQYPSISGTGELVPLEWGALNITAMDSHGGWIASPTDLVKFMSAADGFPTKPDFLNSNGINEFTKPSAVNPGYAKGISVNQWNNWWHNGSLPGTRAFLARIGSGYNFAVLVNASADNDNLFWPDFDGLPHGCYANASSFPNHDLSLHPTKNPSNVRAENIFANKADISWENGNGNKRLVLAQSSTQPFYDPIDGLEYSALNNLKEGEMMVDGSKVVYNGTGNNFSIEGLDPFTTYHLKLIEYSQMPGTGNHSLYKLCDESYASFESTGESNVENLVKSKGIHLSPNPTVDFIKIENLSKLDIKGIKIINVAGQLVESFTIPNEIINTSDYQKGIYQMLIETNDALIVEKFVKI